MTSTDDTSAVIEELLALLNPPELAGRRGAAAVRSLVEYPTFVRLVEARLKVVGSDEDPEIVAWTLIEDVIKKDGYKEHQRRRPLLAARYLLAQIPDNPAELDQMLRADTGRTMREIVKLEGAGAGASFDANKRLRQKAAVLAGRYGTAYNRLSSTDGAPRRNLEEVAGVLWAALSERLYDNARMRHVVGLPPVAEESVAPSPEVEAARSRAITISASIQRRRNLDALLTGGAILLGLAVLVLIAIFGPMLSHEWGWDQIRINVGAGDPAGVDPSHQS